MKNANCVQFYSADGSVGNQRNWNGALSAANNLADGYCGLSDGSEILDWRLPNIRELMSLLDYGQTDSVVPPDLPLTGNPVDPVYWSSTTVASATSMVWGLDMREGAPVKTAKSSTANYVMCVRGGR